jgi:hypothetical protein
VAAVVGRDRRRCHIGEPQAWCEDPLQRSQMDQTQLKCYCHELIDELKQDS